MPSQIHTPQEDPQSGSPKDFLDCFRLVEAVFDRNYSMAFQVIHRVTADCAVCIESVRPAIEGETRIMVAHFLCQRCNLVGPYIGRVCDNYIETARNGFRTSCFPPW